jgi:hypothetical protein
MAFKILVGKPDGTTSLGNSKCRQEYNIKMILKTTGCEAVG